MNELLFLISLPFIIGVITLFIPTRVKFIKEAIAFVTSIIVLILSVKLFAARPLSLTLGKTLLLQLDSLSGFVSLFVALFGLLIIVYSLI